MTLRIYVSSAQSVPVLDCSPFVSVKNAVSINWARGSGTLVALHQCWQAGELAEAGHTGLMQARRYLSLSPKNWRDGVITGFDARTCHRYGWSEKAACAAVAQHDLLIPYAEDVSELAQKTGLETVRDFYLSEGGQASDIEVVKAYLREYEPALYIPFCDVLHGARLRPWLLFVARNDVLSGFCEMLFPALSTVEAAPGGEERTGFQREWQEFLAEILFNAHVRLLSTQGKVRVAEKAVLFLDTHDYGFSRDQIIRDVIARDGDRSPIVRKEINYGGRVNIVISFDSNYVRQAGALINSVLCHTGNQADITFYILHDHSLSVASRKQLLKTYEGITRLVFLPIGQSFVDGFPLNRDHITVSAYYRLLIHNLVPEDVTRVIYLDTDMIVCKNIVDLWNMDLHNHVLGGVVDETDLVAGWNLFGPEGLKRKKGTLYINSGVLLFDIARARQLYGNLDNLYVDSFYSYQKSIRLQDQDILNIAYRGQIETLPLEWNVGASLYYCQTGPAEGALDGREQSCGEAERQAALRSPAIVHFTGRQKPWKMGAMHPLKRLYWHYYRKTPGQSLGVKERLAAWNHHVTVRGRGLYWRRDAKWHVVPFRRKG